MYIIKFGGYTLPAHQLDMSESMGASRRGARSELPGTGGALDAYGTGPDPAAADSISKAFIIEAASPADLQTAVDDFIGQMMLSQSDWRQGLRMLVAALPDGTKRQSWAKCTEARAMWEYFNVNEAWLPVQCTFERPWPVWEKFEDARYLGDHLGTLADSAAAGWLLGPGGGSLAIGRSLLRCAFDGSDAGVMGEAATTGGPVIFGTGQYGQARQLAEATTNLVTNPSAETGTTGWSQANIATWEAASGGYFGSQAFRIYETSNGGNETVISSNYISVSAATAYTFSQYVKKVQATGTGFMIINWYNAGQSFLSNSTLALDSGTHDWKRYTLTATSPATAAYAKLYIFTYGGITVGTPLELLIDGVQFEQKPYPTPYCDGSLSGHSWSGTAHASTSSRPAATLRYANPLSAAAGTLALRWKPACDNTGPTMYLFSEGNLKAYFNAADDKIYFTDGTNPISTAALTFSAEVWQSLIFTWGSAGLKAYRNGAEAASGATYTAPVLGANLYIGSDTAGANQAGGLLDDLAVLDRAVSAAEAQAVSASAAPPLYGTGVAEGIVNGTTASLTLPNAGNTRVMGGIIEFDGAITNPVITNSRNKYSLSWAGELLAGDRLTINIASFDAKKNGQRGEWANISLGQLVPMVLEPGSNPLTLTCDAATYCTFRFYYARSFS